ncbi:hypothetical protein SAMN05421740_103476 [Parapedobacter koreensis]|uniref:Uncharacterized protein n=1 Tax=Parapedobacter koreensis TaxID=332977 RepID=A0A1H7MEQ0_9SPHI|nr:hypothetical protein SAMN05421740_103476 [Parapedobacter koreensis]
MLSARDQGFMTPPIRFSITSLVRICSIYEPNDGLFLCKTQLVNRKQDTIIMQGQGSPLPLEKKKTFQVGYDPQVRTEENQEALASRNQTRLWLSY